MKIKPVNNQPNAFKLTANLTEGKIIALHNALAKHQTAVGQELCAALKHAAQQAGIHLN